MSIAFKSHRPAAAPKSAAPAAKHAPGQDPAARKRAASYAEQAVKDAQAARQDKRAKEIGGPEGPEPTRYGDWERKGICYDF